MEDTEGKETKPEAVNKQNELIEYYQKIIERADIEIERVHSVYKWLATCLTIIITVGLSIATFLTINTIGEIRKNLQTRVDRLEGQVQIKIDEEFDRENINGLVQTTAKERIDTVADLFISEKINEQIIPLKEEYDRQLQDANERLTALEEKYKTTIKLADDNLKKQEKITEYLMVYSNALNNDRKAYDRLGNWGSDKSFLLSSQASAAYGKIRNMHSYPFFQEYNLTGIEGIDPAKFTFAQLKEGYDNIQTSDAKTKTAMITYIWKREDIPKKDRMEFLINIIENDENLNAVEYAGRYFSQGANLQKDPLAVDEYITWWEQNKEKLK